MTYNKNIILSYIAFQYYVHSDIQHILIRIVVTALKINHYRLDFGLKITLNTNR